eukprot:9083329-Pyramimonas_sp.AAC.1
MLGPAVRGRGLAERRARGAEVDMPHLSPRDQGADDADHVLVSQVVPRASGDVDGHPATEALA